MKLKWLHEFKVNKTINEVVEEKAKNDKGEEVITKKENKRVVPSVLAMKKPNRKMHEEGELFYAVKLSEGIKSGLLTRALLAKRYKNDGGPMSENEKRRYAELYYQMLTKQEKIEKLKLNIEGEDDDRRNTKAAELLADLVEIREEIQEYELAQNSLFDQTAEKRAQNQTIMWWVLNLAHEKLGEDFFPIFGDGDFDSKLQKYDDIEEEDDIFWVEVVKKFAYYTTFWYLNGITTKDEFTEVENLYRRDNNQPSIEEEKETKATEAKAKEEEAKEEAKKTEEKTKKAEAKKKKTPKKAKAKKTEVKEEAPEEEQGEAVEEDHEEDKELVTANAS